MVCAALVLTVLGFFVFVDRAGDRVVGVAGRGHKDEPGRIDPGQGARQGHQGDR